MHSGLTGSRAPRCLARGTFRPGPDRDRNALGGVYSAAESSEPHRGGRGTRRVVQAAGRISLFGARSRGAARAACAGSGRSSGPPRPRSRRWKMSRRARYSRHAAAAPARRGAAARNGPRRSAQARRAIRDCRSRPCSAMERHLKNGGQVIVFLNRRGYAPSLFCNACGWVAPCAHCDARMTLHRRARAAALPSLRRPGQRARRLRRAAVSRCMPSARAPSGWRRPWCDCFPDAPLARLDRDTAAARGAMGPCSIGSIAARRGSWSARRCSPRAITFPTSAWW